MIIPLLIILGGGVLVLISGQPNAIITELLGIVFIVSGTGMLIQWFNEESKDA